ncbi:unnamed protein product [Rotaria sp. Silwood1]|nr:unnamed protein product [Rotaria sp. Silwood1]
MINYIRGVVCVLGLFELDQFIIIVVCHCWFLFKFNIILLNKIYKMSKTTSLIGKESLKNLDASHEAYADNDGVFHCILNKNDSDNQLMTHRMHTLVLNEAPQYCLLLYKPDGQSIIETSDSNIDLVNERAFFNMNANALDRTYKYVHDGITWRIPLPDISSEIIISSSNVTPVNCKLFLAGYNGELYDKNDLNAYKYTKGFELLTIDNKSISIGYLIEELSSNNNYEMHNCSTLTGSSGAVIVDSIGRFIGIHIEIANSRISKKNEFFDTQDTFNKFIHVHSTSFKTFIHEAIIPNINNDQLEQKWEFV